LGADPGAILRLILREGLQVVGLGLLSGVIAAFLCTRFMSGLLYDVEPADPLSYTAACVLLLTVSTLACILPAHRATRVDPMVALRCD
jgi:ABC-type lipoprotein release transport system permease subunit